MSTLRSQITAKFVELLNGSGKPTGLTVDIFRVSRLETANLPLTNIRPQKETVQSAIPGNPRCGLVERRLRIKLEHWVSGDTPEDAVEAQLAWSTQAILADPRLAGLAVTTEEVETEWDPDLADTGVGIATQIFEVRYTTKVADQEVKA